MTAPLTDAELVARCRTGDEEAWKELVNRFSRYVYAICVQGFRLRQHDAEDLFQDVFARAYQHLDNLRDEAALRPWLGQLTRRLCLDRLAAERHVDPARAVEDPETDDSLAKVEDAFEVHEALGAIGNECREILDRFFARDESYRTIADELQIPPGTVASRISRCLAKLRTHLEGRNA